MPARIAALVIVAPGLAIGPASAGADGFYYNFYGRFQPPIPLPQGPRATIRVPLVERRAQADAPPVDTLRDLFPALAACWQPPDGLKGLEHTEITARFSLRRDGSVIGTPAITFSTLPNDSHARAVLVRATLDALQRCTPARITPALGGAIAGTPLSIRFVYDGPGGRKT